MNAIKYSVQNVVLNHIIWGKIVKNLMILSALENVGFVMKKLLNLHNQKLKHF
jgi:transcriptional regulator of NAD metabolism